MPKVSVIVPIYKAEQFIEKCVRSLFEQSLDDIEYIFVDDCSPDNSMSIVKNVSEDYPNRKKTIKYLYHSINRGNWATRNTGLSVATGDYITYCDSDDWVDLSMYERLYNHAVSEGADICISDFNFAYVNKIEYYKCTSIYDDKIKTINSYIGTGWTILVNMIAKRQIYSEYDLRFPEDITYCEDFWLSVRLFYYAKKIVKVDKAFYYYNQMNTQSIVHSLNKKHESEERWAYLDTIDFFKREQVYDKYKKTMCWRILKATYDAAVSYDRYKDFLNLYPESHKYIWNCPYPINLKSRIIMSLLAFYPLRFVGVFIIWLRKLFKR